MFTVDHKINRINPVAVKRFSDMGLTERAHLQEWLAHHPNALGEELLIIQKEFDGFDDTRERLDLLALDKYGNLVIIENKLDDSGRDVVWQALKYASYCATLTKAQIVEIYQQYLEKQNINNDNSELADATSYICEFLDAPALDEVRLNTGNSQRIMLVAANFRKEVTITALWLLDQGINIQCFKVTPYALGEQLLINIDQIIPTPEAKELMIGIKAKEIEEKDTETVLKSRHIIRREYWSHALEAFQKSNCTLYNNISPSKDHRLSAGSGLSGCSYNLIFSQKEIRVELWISRSSTEENKFIFDHLMKRRDFIESTFNDTLDWMRLNQKKSCRIQFSKSFSALDKDSWNDAIAWHVEHMSKLEQTLKKPLHQVGATLKKHSTSNENKP